MLLNRTAPRLYRLLRKSSLGQTNLLISVTKNRSICITKLSTCSITFSGYLLFRPFTYTRLRSPIVKSLSYKMVETTDRLAGLRNLMKKENVDVYVVPSEDSHNSEYTCSADARRAFLTGFTGSAGCAVVTAAKAAMSTDGRYFNQATSQLDSNWELLKQGLPDVLTWQEWVVKESEGGKSVGLDATLITSQQAKSLDSRIKKKGGAGLVGLDKNLVDEVWLDRPARPNNPVIVLSNEYAGQSFQEKIEAVRKELEKKKSPGFVVSMLDEIAWLYNLRGSDIPYNPVFFAYALITPISATLYIDSKKLLPKVLQHLGDTVVVRPYQEIFNELSLLAQKATDNSTGSDLKKTKEFAKKWLVSNKTSWALSKALGGDDCVEVIRSPIEEAKAVKNKTERSGMRHCHIRDGAAQIKYFSWLEEQLANGIELDEVQAADKLKEFRKEQDKFMGLSFDTISSSGGNAAIIHYKPELDSCSQINPNKIYLCDSGAQYLDGTTDTTRTVHFGTPTEMETKAYTLVLKGMIALDRVVFPKGTSGFALDVLARQFLWTEGLDYRHGTGHGVGSFLNVHEGPIGIGTRLQYSEVPLAPGMVISDEPGYYEDGNFGIRIENIIMVKEVKKNHTFGDKPFYGFEHVTMVPLCKKLTDKSLLTPAEKMWINNYHKEVYEKTKGYFEENSTAMKWLERETSLIST